jgi:dienelactone hydrolase
LGGAVALALARAGYQCSGIVTFHGLLSTQRPAAGGEVRSPLLICSGAEDALVSPEQLLSFQKEMTAASADFQIAVFGGAGHSFTKPDAAKRPGFGYHRQADRDAWSLAANFFRQRFSNGDERLS